MLRTLAISIVLLLMTAGLSAEKFADANTAFNARQYKEALEIWLVLAQDADIEAQLKVSKMYINGHGTKQNNDKAIFWLKKAAALGSHQAEFELGNLLASGRAIDVNLKKSVQWYRRAAEGGYADAQYSLGVSYFKGTGLPIEYETAYAWMTLASEQGHATAASYRDMISSVLKPSEIEKAELIIEKLKRDYF